MFSRKDWVTGSSYLLAAAGILAVLSLHLLHGLFAAMLVYMLVHLAQPLVGKSFAGQRGKLVVTALPGEQYPFVVTLVTPVAKAREGKNFFRVEARLESPSRRLRPGMEGIATVSIGERRLVWIWTHSFFDWLRLQAWSWLGI